jgi:hypothetical protein
MVCIASLFAPSAQSFYPSVYTLEIFLHDLYLDFCQKILSFLRNIAINSKL